MDENKNYSTSSLNLATFLCAKEFKLLDIKNGSRRKTFIFEDSDRLKNLIRIFNFGEVSDPELMVNARDILQMLRNLKAKLYNSEYHNRE